MSGFTWFTPTVMPIPLGAPMDENPPDAEPIVIFTATYGLVVEALPDGFGVVGSDGFVFTEQG